MTIQALNQLRDLRREIRMDTRRLAELETQATHITPALSGLPSGSGDTQKLERYAAAIADLRTVIEDKRRRCIDEQKRLEAYIAGIPDSHTRQIFTLRFVEGLSWQQVANVVGNNTSDSVRKCIKRYLQHNS